MDVINGKCHAANETELKRFPLSAFCGPIYSVEVLAMLYVSNLSKLRDGWFLFDEFLLKNSRFHKLTEGAPHELAPPPKNITSPQLINNQQLPERNNFSGVLLC